MQYSLRILVACMLLTSFITHTIDIDSSNLIISRMTISDVFGLLALVLFGLQSILKNEFLKKIPKLYIAAIGVAICFIATIITSLNPISTLFETLIVVYLICLSFVIYEVFKNKLKLFFLLIMSTCFTMSFIGLYDLFAVSNNMSTFFHSAYPSHAISGFRYFAQASNYSFTMLTLLIPFRYYKNSNLKLSQVETRAFNATVLITILFMIASGAISIILSFVIAVLIFLAINFRNRKVRIDMAYMFGAVLTFAILTYFHANSLFTNIKYRMESRVTDRKQGTLEANFIVENFQDTIVAFKDNYLFGTGLGGFIDNYSVEEIHGTYLKVLGETGLIGTIGYLVFLILFIRFVLNLDKKYLNYFIPFLMASLVSWSYNYHFRKKEFWIFFAFMMVFGYMSQKKTSDEQQ